MTRIEKTRQIFDEQLEKIKSDAGYWENILAKIAVFYKRTFAESLLLCAQNDTAKIVGTMRQWNRFGRDVRAGQHGIAVFTKRTDTTLRYLFDIDQTYGKEIYATWNLQRTVEKERLLSRYNEKHGTQHQDVREIIHELSLDALNELDEEIDAAIEEHNPSFSAEAFRRLTKESMLVMVLSRCGYRIKPNTFDFSLITSVVPPALLAELGDLSVKAAQKVLLEIENAIRRNDYVQQEYQVQGNVNSPMRGRDRNGHGGTSARLGSAQRQESDVAESAASNRLDGRTSPDGTGNVQLERSDGQNIRGDSAEDRAEIHGSTERDEESPPERPVLAGTGGRATENITGSGQTELRADAPTGGSDITGGTARDEFERTGTVAAPVTIENNEQEDDSSSSSLFVEGRAFVEILSSTDPLLPTGNIYDFAEANELFLKADMEQQSKRKSPDYRGEWCNSIRYCIYLRSENEDYEFSARYDSGSSDGTLLEHLEKLGALFYNKRILNDEEKTSIEQANNYRKDFIPLLKNIIGEVEEKTENTEISEQILEASVTESEPTILWGSDVSDGDWFTESELLYDFVKGQDNVSFALANKLLEYLDEKQHIERRADNHGWYKKTYFRVVDNIGGDEYNYLVRFDIGDGKGTGGGSIIEHIQQFNQMIIDSDRYPYNSVEAKDDARNILNVFIPELVKHSELSADEQKIFNDFVAAHPIEGIENDAADKQKIANFKSATDGLFQSAHIDGLRPREIEERVREHIQQMLSDGNIEAQIVDLAVTGSRSRGLENENSDLDIAVEFTTDIKEDSLFNIFHEEPLEIGGVKVDINPIRKEQTGSLGDYLENAEKTIVENHTRRLAENGGEEEQKINDESDSVIPMPDTLSVVDMNKYGYEWDGMLPLGVEKAMELFEKENVDIFLLYNDGTESLAESKEAILEHSEKGGIMGIERADWNTLVNQNEEPSPQLFDTTEFEEHIPYEMRFKEVEPINENEIYWVTQGIFSVSDLQEFQQAVREYGGAAEKFYVTSRSVSQSYTFEEDSENKVLAIVTPDEIVSDDYVKAVTDAGLGDYLTSETEIEQDKAEPTITCEWSESSAFEDGKTYSVREFDEIMRRADKERIDGQRAGIAKYGSWENLYESDDEEYIRFLGYDKVKFTINMPDGSKYTDRQDIGDGFGGVIDFLRRTENNAIADVLEKSAYGEVKSISVYRVGDFYEIYGDQARSAAEILNIHLTKKNGNDMCGFPAYVMEDYRTKLENSGYTVRGYIDSSDAQLSASGEAQLSLFDTDIREDKTRSERRLASLEEKQGKQHKTRNFHLAPGESIDYAKGAKAKYADNVAAIRTLKNIEKEKRAATPDEQKTLAKYVGWGGLSDAFDEKKENWHKEYVELKMLLDSTEYKSAFLSVNSSFFTDPELIRPIWDTLKRFGFQGGEILEPAMGVGNFFSVIPLDIAQNSHLHGVELDSISGRIARLLYPDADIKINGYENVYIEDSSIDVAIGNVPFENFKINDSTRDIDFVLHDYFFVKTIDKLKSGGILAFITSTGTLDKYEYYARRIMAEKADLIGAIRLPDNAFRQIAGTETATDVIFFQKLEKPRIADYTLAYSVAPWIASERSRDYGSGSVVNKYFQIHEDLILADGVTQRGRFGIDIKWKAKEGADLYQEFDTALGKLHAKFTALPTLPEIDEEEETTDTRIEAPLDVENYSYYIHTDGNLYYRENDYLVLYEGRNAAVIKAMCVLRDKLQRVIDIQIANENGLEKAQMELSDEYDKFVKKYGYLNKPTNESAFREDVKSALLMSLEKEASDGKYEKADIFTKATVSPQKIITTADTAQDALIVSLNTRGEVNIPYIAKLIGKSEEEAIAELGEAIFREPHTGGWVTAEEYLSGDVVTKLSDAKTVFEQDPDIYQRNVSALQEVQPVKIGIEDIDFNVGQPYIPMKLYEDFCYEKFGYRPNGFVASVEISYSDILNTWKVSHQSYMDDDEKISSVYGTKRATAWTLFESSLNQSRITIKDPYTAIGANGQEVTKYKINDEETKIARARQRKIENEFREWVLSNDSRVEQIETEYNNKYNRLRPRVYDGSYIEIDGISRDIALRPHQLNAVAKIAAGGCVMLAHEVGAGKTATMASAGMYLKQIGTVKKPLYVVPKPIVAQWGREFARFFPTARVLVTSEKDFEKKNRRRFLGKIATGEYDAIIMSHSQFEKIPISLWRQQQYLEKKKAEISEAKREIRESRGGRDLSVKALAAQEKRIDAMLDKLKANAKKDKFVTFEELGCDYLFVDEAHAYKNLGVQTRHSNVAGVNASTTSQRAFDMEMKVEYIQELNDGGGVTFATGTPYATPSQQLQTA